YSYTSIGALVFGPTGSSYVVGDRPFWPATGGPFTVVVQGPGGITMTVPRAVSGLLRVSAPVLNADLLTLGGATQLLAGGSLSPGPFYSGNATLVYRAAATVGDEWGPGSVVGPGEPRNVTIQAESSVVALPSGDRNVPGDLTVVSGTL